MRDDGPVRVRQVGASALLVEVDDPRAWFAELWRRREAGEAVASEIVPGARTVLLDGVPDPAALAARLPGWAPRAGAAADSGPVAFPQITGVTGVPGRVAARRVRPVPRVLDVM